MSNFFSNLAAPSASVQHLLSVAPMMDWTDRHDRYFLRLISQRVMLYTEMITAVAVVRGNRQRLLDFNPAEHPLAVQLGGCDPQELAEAARIVADFGYDEVNLNVGCPSDRVQSGRFGACLMAEPELVAQCVATMAHAVQIPITVKTRLGIDERDSYEELSAFVGKVAESGCRTFIIHARKAWLKGLSPKENRTVPPLQPDKVYRLKQDFPHLEIVINGGIKTLEAAREELTRVDGVMIGREAYENPYILAEVDRLFFNDAHPIPSRLEILEKLMDYIEEHIRQGGKLHYVARHLVGLFQEQAGARLWRRYLSEHIFKPGAGPAVLREAAALVY